MREGKVSGAGLLLLFFFPLLVLPQDDSLTIPEVNVSALPGKRPLLRVPGTVSVIDSAMLYRGRAQSLLPVLNSVAGVRMEERSPGSYRLSVRGSLLRSPFGIRNLKVYMDEMPLTNAGGETYLNLIDQWAIQNVEIHKGPDGSLFGVNSGGVVRLGFFKDQGPATTQAEATAGSFGLYRSSIRTDQAVGKHRFFITAASESNGGYRHNTSLRRYFVQGGETWKYNSRSRLRITGLYSDLHYETPGGLTAAQQVTDPRLARPRSGPVPGAEEQKAGIYNKTLLGSVTNELKLATSWEHMFCVFGSWTDFKNPFITNYETRSETNFGLRTWARYQVGESIKKEFIAGAEQQFMNADISNYANEGGSRGMLLGADETEISQGFLFTRIHLDFYNRLFIEGALSINRNHLGSTSSTNSKAVRDLEPQLMPRAAMSVLVARGFSFRALVSRGYSAPTLQELRPAAGTFNPALQPEHGWNYEVGSRWVSPDQRYRADCAAFIYQLVDAIVRRVDPFGNEYFMNAGGTSQPGVELEGSAILHRAGKGFLRSLEARGAATLYEFRFVNYSFLGQVNSGGYFGNNITGVPNQVFSANVTFTFPARIFVFMQHLHVSALPLNDGNSQWAPAYGLMQVRGGWNVRQARPFMQVSFACDNVLDQLYSAGHDLNAFGGRFYNPAPGRNYFAQVLVKF